MQFLIVAHDYTDAEAPERRRANRETHLAVIDGLKQTGNMLTAGAILSDSGTVLGSALVCQFPTRAELDAWLEVEPFVVARVWEQIEVREFRPAPAFAPA